MAIFSAFIEPVVKLAQGMVEEFHLSPEKKAAVEAQIREAAAQADQADKDYEVKIATLASQNMQSDSNNVDWFVRRWRPAVGWSGVLVILWNYMIMELIKTGYAIWGSGHIVLPTFNPPPIFWYIWGGLAAGGIFTRSMDKVFGGSGGAFELGKLKIDSKGD